jgi:hypothetical protein
VATASQPASQPSCHKLDSTNQRRGCGHRCTFGPCSSRAPLLSSTYNSLRPSRDLALPRSAGLFFLSRSVAALRSSQHLPANPLILINLLLRETPTSLARILASASVPRDRISPPNPVRAGSYRACHHPALHSLHSSDPAISDNGTPLFDRSGTLPGNRLNN